jgi:hypothetical protein
MNGKPIRACARHPGALTGLYCTNLLEHVPSILLPYLHFQLLLELFGYMAHIAINMLWSSARVDLTVCCVTKQALRRDPDSTACARGLKRVRALVSAKEQGNTAFKERRWGDAHRHYSDALSRYVAGAGNEAFFAQCYSNRCALSLRNNGKILHREKASNCAHPLAVKSSSTGQAVV